jgi:uncharacterized protein involved in outer membrane biogenesis
MVANRRLRLTVYWVGGVLAFIAIAGFLIAPPIVRYQLEKQLALKLHRPVTVERVRINPFALNASVEKLRVGERDGSGTAFSFESLRIDVTYRSVLRLAPVVGSLRLTGPYLNVVRNEDRKYNFQDLLDEFAAAKPEPAPPQPTAPPKFAVYNIELTDGRIDFDDRPEKTKHEISDIGIGVPFLSSIPSEVDIYVQPHLSAKINGAPFALDGTTKPFKDTRETTLHVNLDDLEIARYLEYSPLPLRIRMPSGRLDVKVDISLATAGEKLQTLAITGTAALRELAIQSAEGTPLLAFNALRVELDALDLVGRNASVKQVTLQGPVVNVVRSKDGVLNWQRLVDATAPSSQNGGGKPASDESPFAFSVASASIEGGKADFIDHSTTQPFSLSFDSIALAVRDLARSAERDAPLRISNITLDVSTNAGGKVHFNGAAQVAPLKVDGAVALEGFRLFALASYYDEWLNVVVKDGRLATKGKVIVEQQTGQPLRVGYRGDASIANFESYDKAGKQELLRWKTLTANGIDFQLEPMAVRVNEFALGDFYSRLILQGDGTLNLQHVIKDASERRPAKPGSGKTETVSAKPGQPARLAFGHVAFKNGRVNFSDFFIKPNYSVDILRMTGTVSEMNPEKAGNVLLRGSVGRNAPIEVNGKVNPFARDLFFDIKAEARNIDLPPLSTYAVKYAGYGIEKGSLSFKVSYLLEKRQLKASNNINLDQLTFGPPVESATATKLPVTLAIALLKDRNGVIDIDLPISGTLDDPQFSIGGVILKALGNLITRIVTAPFTLLANLVGGGGPELGYVEFTAGRASLSSASESKLQTLAKALDQRPALKLEVTGRVDPATDRDGLKQVALERLIKAQKLKQAKGKEKADTPDERPLAELKLESGEYARLLTAVYKDAKFDRPRNVLGFLKEVPVPEMEQMMLANLPVSDADLNVLADERSAIVKDWLTEKGKIPAERVYLLASKKTTEGIKDKGSPMRADFSIR